MAAVRPEFRVDILTPDQDDPVLGWKRCAAAGCDRPVKDYELCNAHSKRWRKQGRPDLAAFLSEPGPPQRGRAELARCTVLDCRYGVSGQGLCARHRDRWARSGFPDPAAWAATVPAMDSRGRIECRLSFCTLWCENAKRVFCKSHETRWRQRGRPNVEEFIAECERLGKAYIDFRGLPSGLKLELQYALQCRHDEQSVTAPARVVMWAIHRAKEAGVTSLLDRSEGQWRQMARRRRRTEGGGDIPPRNETFLIYARDAVETLRDGAGWESEYPRDIWRLHKLGGLKTSAARPQGRSHLGFDRIAQPWLKDLAKRWVRLRLSSGLAIPTATSDVQALTRFSEFLSVAAPEVDKLAGIDRPLLERYLAWLATQPGGVSANEDRVNGLHLFLQAIRQYTWDDTLPTTAAFYTGDCPRRSQRIGRHLAEFVMAQVERPANLDRWPHPEGRLVTLILIRCGMRVSDACTLPFDCLLHDGQGAPYLRYVNHKMNRQAAVPIDEELQAEVRAQQSRVLERWPDGNPHLFPRQKANANGQRSFGSDSYRKMLNRWLASCDIRQEVVRVLLDHDSMQMTAHYARITDQTVRRRWEEATRVNIKGEQVTIDPDGPLAQAQWAKTRYGIATQTLPNGYCGLPLQQSCPHANACLAPCSSPGPSSFPSSGSSAGAHSP
jgi:integrase